MTSRRITDEQMKRLDAITNRHFLDLLADVEAQVLMVFGSKLRQLILYGSYARNEQDPESDIDIMALVDEPESTLRESTSAISGIMTSLSLKHDTLVSITEETYSRFYEYLDVLPFFRNISNEGIEIYGSTTA